MTRRITVDVYEADNTTYVGTLGSDKGREWLEDLDGNGAGSIQSHLDLGDAALLTDGRIVRFQLDGESRWAGCELAVNQVLADPDQRASGRVLGLSSKDLLSLFDYAAVLPELGFGRISPTTRYLGWMSRYYDHSWWDNATEFKLQSDPDLTKPWAGAPRGCWDPDARWVGPPDGDVPGADPGGGTPGDMYAWGTYTIPSGEGGDWVLGTTADDGFQIFRDGGLEGAEARVALWGVWRELKFQADEGAHYFGAKITNFDRPDNSTNVFGYILSLAPMLGGGVKVGTPVTRSGSGTKILAWPETEPGMTAGHMMLVFIAENQELDWLPTLTCDFTETEDSNGVPWPKEYNLAFQVGDSLTQVMAMLRDMKAAEFAMDPEGLVLHAYVSKGVDRTGSVAVTYAGNVHRLGMNHKGPGANTTISRTAEGRFVLTEDSDAVEAWGRRITGMSQTSAASDASAAEQTSAFFEDHANPSDAITQLQVEDDAFLDGTVRTGDLVTGPSSAGPASYRVHGLRFADDPTGSARPVCTPELVKV